MRARNTGARVENMTLKGTAKNFVEKSKIKKEIGNGYGIINM